MSSFVMRAVARERLSPLPPWGRGRFPTVGGAVGGMRAGFHVQTSARRIALIGIAKVSRNGGLWKYRFDMTMLHVTNWGFAMPSSVRHRVQTHRAQLRAMGLRPIQIWVPDVRSPAFKEEARRQSRAVAASPDAAETMDFLEDVQDFGDEP
jgi:hypothetical protein